MADVQRSFCEISVECWKSPFKSSDLFVKWHIFPAVQHYVERILVKYCEFYTNRSRTVAWNALSSRMLPSFECDFVSKFMLEISDNLPYVRIVVTHSRCYTSHAHPPTVEAFMKVVSTIISTNNYARYIWKLTFFNAKLKYIKMNKSDDRVI